MEDQKVYNDNNSEFVKALLKYMVDIFRQGISMAVKDSATRKQQLDYYIENELYDKLSYLTYEKPGLFPFAVSSQMSPKVSYKNKPMNNHTDPSKPFSQPMITFLPDKKSTFAILAAFPEDDPAINLLDELDDLPDPKLEKAISSLIIANCENTFFAYLLERTDN